MTDRQWVLVQYALLFFRTGVDTGAVVLDWDEELDGPAPRGDAGKAEVDELMRELERYRLTKPKG